MRILRLSYKNFKAQSRDIELNGADIDVFGANGVGKTTAFEAFTWLLFGKDRKGAELAEDIKTRSAVDNGLEHEAEAILELDGGRTVRLKRVFHETWTKKRGSATETFSGHTTDFFIDDVPAKKKEYAEKINSIVEENRFKLLTDPNFFKNQLSWQERRKILIEVCGDVSEDDVISSNPLLRDLTKILGGKNIDDYRKMVQAKRSKVNDELKKIPVRIDEAQRNMPELTSGLNEEVLQTELADIKTKQMALNRQIAKIENGSAVSDKQVELAEIKAKKLQIKTRYDREINRKAMDNLSVISGLNDKKNRFTANIADGRKKIEFLERVISDGSTKLQRLRDEWKSINHAEFDTEISDCCPTCGQKLPADRVEAARRKALEAFNLDKSARLADNNANGKEASAKLKESGSQIEQLQASIADMEAKIEAIDIEVDKLQESAENVLDFSQDEAYLAADKRQTEINAEIEELNQGSKQEIQQIQAEIRVLDTDIDSRQEKLAIIKSRKDMEERITELQAEQKKMAADFEEIEHCLYLTDLFIKTKVSMLDQKINSKFKIAQFRLFADQVNGGLTECCDVLYDGVVKMSNSQEIKVGLDIIQTLSKHYGISTPIFVDNCESITELPPMDGQVIRLIVSAEDKELRIERKDKEQAAA